LAIGTDVQQLIRALPEDERKRLYDRIVHSLSLTESADSKRIYKSDLGRDQRLELIERDMSRMGLAMRIKVWWRKLVSGKSADDAYVDARLAHIAKRIRRAPLSIRSLDPDSVPPQVAERFYYLYQHAYGVIPFFVNLWHSNDVLREMIHNLLKERVPEPKNELSDFVSLKEMQDIFLQKENHAEIRTVALSRLDEYMKGIQGDLFEHLQRGVLPLYYFKDICLFDFRGFFRLFGADVDLSPPETPPEFQEAESRATREALETMFYAVYISTRIRKGFFVHRELLEYYVRHQLKDDAPDESEQGIEESRVEEEVRRLKNDLEELNRAVSRFHTEVPLAEMIRYYQQDPYYRFVIYPPRLDLRDFYYNSLRMKILAQLDERFRDVRIGVVGRLINSLFRTEPPELEYFSSGTSSTISKLGLPTFHYVRSLGILYGFIVARYRKDIQEFIRLLNRVFPQRDKDTSGELAFHAAGVEDVADKIKAFDERFSPDADDGKNFLRLRYAVEKDKEQHKPYRVFVAQKDREAKELLNKGIEHIQAVYHVFRTLTDEPTTGLEERFAAYEAGSARGNPLANRLASHADTLENFLKLMNQLIAMDEGA